MNKSSQKKVAVKKSETAVIVAKAMKMLASAFSEPYEAIDRQTGEVSVKNSMGFWQDGVLGGVCFQLASKLEYTTNTTIPRAKASVQAAIRSHKGDELSEVSLQRSVEWLQRLMEQAAIGEDALLQAKQEYYAATGKAFGYSPRQTANADVVETPAMLAAKALGIGGINVANGFGSAQPTRTQQMERLPDQHGKVKDGVRAAALKRAAEVKAGKLAAHREAVKRVAAADEAERSKQLTAGQVRGSRTSKPSKLAVLDMSGDDETVIRDFADLASLLASEGS